MRFMSFFVFFALIGMGFAQGSIEGQIVDKDGYLVLPGAQVHVVEMDFYTIADRNGEYKIFNVQPGQYNVEVEYLGYKTLKQQVTVYANQAATLNFELEAGIESGDQIIVVGERLKGQAKALSQQKSNLGVSNVVSSDQVGRFPDSNIGDALKRIPGINVQYDQGEARFGSIRGTEPRLNSLSINGERVASAEAETREAQLDLIPSDMIQTVEVSKVIQADQEADAIGGAVNLVTRQAPYTRRMSVTLGSGYNILRSEPTYQFSGIFADRYAGGKLGAVFSVSYHDNIFGSDNMEAEWVIDDESTFGDTPYAETVEVRRYDIERERISLSAAFDYKLNDRNTIRIDGIYSTRKDWENRFRTDYIREWDDAWEHEIRRQTKAGKDDDITKNARLEHQITSNFKLSGEHYLGNIFLDWAAAYGQASEDRPNERYVRWSNTSISWNPAGDSERPNFKSFTGSNAFNSSSDFEFDELTNENQFTEEKNTKFKVNIEIPLGGKQYQDFGIKVGGRYKSKDKLRDNDFFEFDGDDFGLTDMTDSRTSNYNLDSYEAGNYTVGDFSTPEWLGGLNLKSSDGELLKDEFLAGNYDVNETVIAAFAKFNYRFNNSLLFSGGVRYEGTTFEGDGFRFDEETENEAKVSNSKDYANILPSILLRYDMSDDMVIRAAWSNTISRPNYYDLVPYTFENSDDNEVELGNPDLDATTSMNFDLMFEMYTSNVGLFSVGVFHKNIEDFIFTYEREDAYTYVGDVTPTDDVEIQQPLNGGSATLTGFEIALQRQLTFVPALKNVGVYLNYTFTSSSIDGLPIEGRENDDIGLPGSAEHTFNSSLSYEDGALSMRLSANFSSDYVEAGEVGDEAFEDRYYDEAFFLDFNASYRFTDGPVKGLTAYLEAINLTNQPLRYYQGESSRTMQVEYYQTKLNFGVKYDF